MVILKNPIKVILLRAVNFYRGSSVKPFENVLRNLYLKYIQKKIRENREVIAKIDGVKYRLNLSQGSEFEAYYGGGYEPTVIKIIEKFVKPGNTAIDVGARIGLHALRIKKLVGSKGKVFAVEPDSTTLAILLKNAELNNFEIITENKALSDKNDGKEITLDAYIKEAGITKLDFIKIDTDGWEPKIIQGAQETLKKFRPVMVVELNKESLEEGSLGSMLDSLSSLGYSFFQARNLREYSSRKSINNEVALKGNINILCQSK